MNKSVIVNGTKFSSKRDCYKHFNMKEGTVNSYIYKKKCSFEEAINHIMDCRNRRAEVVNGIEFKDRKSCLDYYGVSTTDIYRYIKKSSTFEEAVNKCLEKGFFYKGIKYKSAKDCCEKLGIEYNKTNAYKKRHNCTWEEAIDKYEVKGFTYRSIVYKNLADCCNKLGIVVNKVYSYKNNHDCTAEEAIDYCLNKEAFIYHRVEYSSARNCCKKLGLVYEYVGNYKRNHNCTWEEAIDHYVNKPNLNSVQELFTNDKGIAYYQCKCSYCKKTLILTQEELDNFQHSEEFCKEHILDF